ncbi:metallophosphoesterase family protein [bacterium]|nr:metallophosphoesterase family protein [candidate division CSSED10-310 bacterium]
MKIAFFSDIHANVHALEACCNDAVTKGAERIFCCGDLVGYGAFPNEVIDFLKEKSISTIRGNYDVKVLKALSKDKKALKKMKPVKRDILQWTLKALTKNSIKYLNSLPETITEKLSAGVDMCLVHGSPQSCSDTVYPSITVSALREKISSISKPDLLVCGHTHIPFIKRLDGVMVINCGSSGQPVDGDVRPAYALIDVTENKCTGSIVRFQYAVDEAAKAIKSKGLPRRLAKDLLGGVKQRETP